MKDLFPQFAHPSEQDYSLVWKQALFVFDTNVLLNLYRYQSATRDELLNVLSQLSDRIWIPHHVALEFQRNRLQVIAEQNKRFADVRRTIEKARTGLFADLEKLATEFLADLDRLHATQQKLSASDPLKAKIEGLFDGRVGQAPRDQASIDDLYKHAESRFKLKIPPGYQDTDKEKDAPDEHVSGGIIYKRKYGDFLVWKQLLANAKTATLRSIVFVTDDGKDDWWWKIDSDGPKTIGPRPELIEEAKLQAGVETLVMYNPEGFLKYAKEFLKAPVSEETLKEVRDVSTTRSLRDFGYREFREMAQRAEQAVLLWPEGRFEKVRESGIGFPDFVAERDGKSFGFDVKLIQQPRMIMNRVREAVYRAYYELKEGRFEGMTIVWIVGNLADAAELKKSLARGNREQMPDSLRMIIGAINDPKSGDSGFYPYEDFAYNETKTA